MTPTLLFTRFTNQLFRFTTRKHMNLRTITTFTKFTSSGGIDTDKELNKPISHVSYFLLVSVVIMVNCPGFNRLAFTKWDYALGELGECVVSGAGVESTATTHGTGESKRSIQATEVARDRFLTEIPIDPHMLTARGGDWCGWW
jgi:hypothetical protein